MKTKEELKVLLEDWLNEELIDTLDVYVSKENSKQIIIGVFLK